MAAVESGTTDLKPAKAILHNLKALPEAASWTGLISGLLVVFVSTTGPIAILYQAAAAGDLSVDLTNSWLFTVFLGSGLFGLYLSLRFAMPIIGTWASTTTALLVTGLVDHKFSDVIGAYFGASILLLIVGMTGLFEKIIKVIPQSLIMAMLAGVLLSFGLRIFTATQVNPILGMAMLLIYFTSRKLKFRAPVLLAFFVGLSIAIIQSKIQLSNIELSPAKPIWVAPTFSLGAFFTLSIPIFLMVMTTQNAPGIVLLKAVNYRPPINQIVTLGGLLSILGSGFAGAGVNVSSMTASIAISPDSDPNPKKRYFSGVVCGLAYCAAAVFAATISTMYQSFPIELTSILAGIALLPIIINSLTDSLADSDFRDAAAVTFLVTISGISGWGVGAPFWGILAGLLIHQITHAGKIFKK